MGKYIYNNELNPISYVNDIPFRFLNYRGNAGNFRIGNSRQLVFIPKRYINENKTLKTNELSWFMNKPVIKHKIELYLEEENKNMDKENNIVYVKTKNGIFKCYESEQMHKPIYYPVESKTNGYIDYNDVIEILNIDDLYEQVKKQKDVIEKINNYIDNYDVFKVFSFPLMKKWEENQVKSSIDYEFKTYLIKDLKDILKEVSE